MDTDLIIILFYMPFFLQFRISFRRQYQFGDYLFNTYPLKTGQGSSSYASVNESARKSKSALWFNQQSIADRPNSTTSITSSQSARAQHWQYSYVAQKKDDATLKNNFEYMRHIYGPPMTDDSCIFKEPRIPPLSKKQTQKQLVSVSQRYGSIESVSSGYQSDGYRYPIGMSNIPKWLKLLRLHKYTKFFDNVTYEHMFTLTEDYFKRLNITQGASHKLGICIEKLKTRSESLRQIELNLSENRMGALDAVQEIESMVMTPMKPIRYCDTTDVGYQLWKVLNLSK